MGDAGDARLHWINLVINSKLQREISLMANQIACLLVPPQCAIVEGADRLIAFFNHSNEYL